MPEMSCPNCLTLRAPNSVYCHACGHVYGTRAAASEPPFTPEPVVHVTEHRMSFSTAVSIGAGLVVGGLLVGIVLTILSAMVFGGILGSFMRSLPGVGS